MRKRDAASSRWHGCRHALVAFASLVCIAPLHAVAAPPNPANVDVKDFPGDDGTKLIVTWERAADSAVKQFHLYRVLDEAEIAAVRRDRRMSAAWAAFDAALKNRTVDEAALAEANAAATKAIESAGPQEKDRYASIAFTDAETTKFTVDNLDPKQEYQFVVSSVDAQGGESEPVATPVASPKGQLFLGTRAWFAPFLVLVCGVIIACIVLARRGRVMHVRRIAGLEAIDEAIGRATEMGRPVLYIAGIQDMDEVQTVAGVTILSRVAKTAAEYDARLEVPTSRSLVMTAARDAVKTAYFEAGRADAYNADAIRYITDEQFGFVAYVAGRMVRKKPAACIYMGQFFAESLLLSETGNSINAIQIAGTAETSQLPFFVAACDYTLIGEELFAASAYLSREPTQLGSLFGQDIGKLLALILIVLSVVVATLGSLGFESMQRTLQTAVEAMN